MEVPHDKGEEVRNVLRKPERIWFGQLGYIKATEMQIDLVPDANPLKSAPYRSSPKTRALERAEIDFAVERWYY